MIEARYWEKAEKDNVRCQLCPHRCLIAPGKTGICAVRENKAGVLYSLNYARAVAVHNDPIEKKPLFHVLPGSYSLSVAAAGCNFRCRHCQNHQISQFPRREHAVPGEEFPAAEVVEAASRHGSATISLTYTEPTVFMEWAEDIGEQAAARGIRCVSVTNGYTNSEPLRSLARYLIAANVDLKAFRDDFYREICGGRLQPVLDTIRLLRELDVWVEVTTLIIPGFNDDRRELEELAKFLVSVDPAMPWHISRFHPDNELLDAPPTPAATIQMARRIGLQAGLRFVYSGNVWGDEGENTYCPACGKLLIERYGFSVRQNRLRSGACPDCGEKIAGRWER